MRSAALPPDSATYAIKQKSTGTGRGVPGKRVMACLFVNRRFYKIHARPIDSTKEISLLQ